MLPYCPMHDWFAWSCVRGITTGGIALTVLCLVGHALRRIWSRLEGFQTNFRMLVFAALRLIVVSIEFLVSSNPRLLFVGKYCRALQVLLTCALYGNLACDLLHLNDLYHVVLRSFLALVFAILTMNLFVMVYSTHVDCHHLSWLVMSFISSVLALMFAISGKMVLRKLHSAAGLHANVYGGTKEREIEQTHAQLWILILCNTCSAAVQLLLDIYIQWVILDDASCDAIFFEGDHVMMEQLLRFILVVVGYILPECMTWLVFYWIPRRQFSTSLDIPDLNFKLLSSAFLDEDDGEQYDA